MVIAVLLLGGDREETAFAYLSVLSRDSVAIVTVDCRRCVSTSLEYASDAAARASNGTTTSQSGVYSGELVMHCEMLLALEDAAK